MSALLILAGFAAQGCDLPTGEHGKTPLTLRLTSPAAVFVNDTVVLEVEARDPEGRVLLEPPLLWEFSFTPGLFIKPMRVLRTEYGRAWVAGDYVSGTHLRVRVPDSDPWFTSDSVATDLPIRYLPASVSFVGVGTDTVLTSRGLFSVKAVAVDEKGREPSGLYHIAALDGVVRPEGNGNSLYGSFDLVAVEIGRDTLVVTHTGCTDSCADTLAVRVEPVPSSIDFPDSPMRSFTLGDSVQLQVSVLDRARYEIPGLPVTWRLVDLADSTILEIIDPSTGAAVTRSNGTARVAARSGALEAETTFEVGQVPSSIRLQVPPHVVGVGTFFTAFFSAFDEMGYLIPASRILTEKWTERTGQVILSEYHARDALLVTRQLGRFVIRLSVPGIGGWVEATAPLRVIPEPDSVKAYPKDGRTTIGGVGVTATWVGDIYLPGETISAVPLFWTSLDPGVATIDMDGVVTGVAPGAARIVGTMGAAADTVTVTVTGAGD